MLFLLIIKVVFLVCFFMLSAKVTCLYLWSTIIGLLLTKAKINSNKVMWLVESVTWYRFARWLPVLIRNVWLTPGWSRSCVMAANREVMTSNFGIQSFNFEKKKPTKKHLNHFKPEWIQWKYFRNLHVPSRNLQSTELWEKLKFQLFSIQFYVQWKYSCIQSSHTSTQSTGES